jgi:threonine dehydratase
VKIPTLNEIHVAQEMIADTAIRTPLVRLNVEGPTEIWLKLEILQPIGSFKIRGARNAMAFADPAVLRKGVYTASAGNMAQGVAWCAREMKIPCTVIVPDHAPATKLAAVERLGASIIKVPFDRWWRILEERSFEGQKGHFIHPVSDPAVIAGNGTIGVEIYQDLPDAEVVLVPYGGGGLSCGIGAALKALTAGDTQVWAAEVETAAPCAASLQAGQPTAIDYRASFVDGAGGKAILPEMWPLVQKLLGGAVVVTLAQVAEAIALLVERNRIVVEGAGAISVAAARSGQVKANKIVCVVSGGNLDTRRLIPILEGRVPD